MSERFDTCLPFVFVDYDSWYQLLSHCPRDQSARTDLEVSLGDPPAEQSDKSHDCVTTHRCSQWHGSCGYDCLLNSGCISQCMLKVSRLHPSIHRSIYRLGLPVSMIPCRVSTLSACSSSRSPTTISPEASSRTLRRCRLFSRSWQRPP